MDRRQNPNPLVWPRPIRAPTPALAVVFVAIPVPYRVTRVRVRLVKLPPNYHAIVVVRLWLSDAHISRQGGRALLALTYRVGKCAESSSDVVTIVANKFVILGVVNRAM